jgi:hypothetical protein
VKSPKPPSFAMAAMDDSMKADDGQAALKSNEALFTQ